MAHEPSTRRAVLHASALVGTAALVNACSASAPSGPPSGTLDASTDAPGGSGPADGATGDVSSAPPSDVLALNNLLAAEYGAIKAYEAVLPIFTAPPAGDPQAGNGPVLAVIAQSWQNHHREHAAQVRAAITALGGEPVIEASIVSTPPPGFTPTVRNSLTLLCNVEKAAAVAYNLSVGTMTAASSRYLATIIEGIDAQHFIVLYGLLRQVITPNVALIITMTNEVVPKAFINNVGSMTNGLNSIADFNYSN